MLQKKMSKELASKELFDQARSYAFEYLDNVEKMDVFPSKENLAKMSNFDEDLQDETILASEVLKQLHDFGSPTTVAQMGSRYFGFVNGSAVPVALGVKWLTDVWDQCGGLHFASPINAKLETICENWLKDIFNLPKETVAGFVSGTSTANLCALAAARFQILKNLGWDVNEDGLYGAPKIRVVAHEQVHASVKKTIALLGIGKKNVEWIPSDDQGRVIVEKLPQLDKSCIVLLQAGNANTGAYDDFDTVCDIANKAGAWVHIDGAFGLWAAASKALAHLTKGMEKASSWAVDGHKTLNTPYDSGIVLCRYPDALISAMQATGEYLIYSDHREPILYTTEMSKRSRAIELWATMKYLGKEGIDQLVSTLHLRAEQLARGLMLAGFQVINKVVFNQVLVIGESEEASKQIVNFIQESGECWLGGTVWNGKAAIRISVCSWRTTEEDIDRTIRLFVEAKESVKNLTY